MTGYAAGLGPIRLVNAARGSSLDIAAAITAPPQVTLSINTASTIELTVTDPRRALLNAGGLDEPFWAHLEGRIYQLVALKKTGDQIGLVLEDSVIAALRLPTSKKTIAAGSTTRYGAVQLLAREAEVPFLCDPDGKTRTIKNAITRSKGVKNTKTKKGKKANSKSASTGDGEVTSSWDVLGTDIAEPIGWRRFSDGTQLIVGSDEWLMSRRPPVELREFAGGVGHIDFDLDTGKPASTASTTIDITTLGLTPGLGPGMAVTVPNLGLGSGTWLIEEISYTTTSPRAAVKLVRAQAELKEPKKEKSTGGGGGGGGGKAGRDSGSPTALPGKEGSTRGSTPAASSKREAMVRFALAQSGKPYVWGASGPGSFDCSGLVQAAIAAAGGPGLAKPVASQWATCRAQGKTIPVSTALRTRGALLIRVGGTYNHIAISLGNGSTVEAMGTAYGCGVFGNAAGRGWNGAALWF